MRKSQKQLWNEFEKITADSSSNTQGKTIEAIESEMKTDGTWNDIKNELIEIKETLGENYRSHVMWQQYSTIFNN